MEEPVLNNVQKRLGLQHMYDVLYHKYITSQHGLENQAESSSKAKMSGYNDQKIPETKL